MSSSSRYIQARDATLPQKASQLVHMGITTILTSTRTRLGKEGDRVNGGIGGNNRFLLNSGKRSRIVWPTGTSFSWMKVESVDVRVNSRGGRVEWSVSRP